MNDKKDLYDDETMLERLERYMAEAIKNQPAVLQASLDKGVPITYVNDAGQLVKEMPDGEIIILEENIE